MMAGDFMFALNDAMGKWLVASFSVGQVVMIRSVGAFIVLGPMIARQGAGGLFRVERPLLQVLRVVAATADTVLFYAAVVYLPLADVMTFYMAAPIYVAALSHLLLGEKVGWRRWLAILIGFGGVVIALRPSSASLSCRRSTRWSAASPSRWRSCSTACCAPPATARWSPGRPSARWSAAPRSRSATGRAPAPVDFGAMLLLGVISCIAHLLITRALKLAPASALAPLHYTLLLWAVVFGFIFFADVPDRQILLGSPSSCSPACSSSTARRWSTRKCPTRSSPATCRKPRAPGVACCRTRKAPDCTACRSP